MRIAKEGYPFIFGLGGLTLVLNLLGWWWTGLGALVATLAVAGFFRDPDRDIPEGDDLVLSPADGRIVSVVEQASPEGMPEETFRRVSIFMSPLNVHVNRVPLGGEVLSVRHSSGRFRAAYSDDASRDNEHNEVTLRDPAGRVLVFVQIAGWMARRIVCRLRPGETAVRGERFGIILFGSRVDVYLPLSATLHVRVGDRVRAGSDVLGELEG